MGTRIPKGNFGVEKCLLEGSERGRKQGEGSKSDVLGGHKKSGQKVHFLGGCQKKKYVRNDPIVPHLGGPPHFRFLAP